MSIDLPGAEGPLLRRVLAALRAAGPKGATAELPVPEAAPEAVVRALHRLGEEGRAVEHHGCWLDVSFTTFEAGTVQILEEGDALFRRGSPEGGWAEAVIGFIPRAWLEGARDGDRVLVQRRRDRWHRAGGRRLPEMAVVRIAERRLTRAVGTLEMGEEGRRWLVPYDSRIRLDVEVAGGDALTEDVWVVVRLSEGEGAGDRVRGVVTEVLGRSEEPGVDVRVALAHYGIPEAFPAAVLEAAAALPEDPPAAARRWREDLTDLPVVTIDGESARDFDDAVSVQRLDGGGFRLGVHIADVAHWVPEGSPLDLEAYRRGTSVYFPDRAVPMLPERLSNGLCSLRPGVPRLTLSVFLNIDPRGRVVGRRFAETVIASKRRLTYDEVRRVLEEGKPSDAYDYREVLGLLKDLRELMELLLAARLARGSVDFDLPEGDVTLDTDGVVVGIVPRGRHVAHRIIEELMIAANEAVAQELLEQGLPALYRVHDPPPAESLEELREVLESFGLELPVDLADLPPAALQRVLREVEDRPEEDFVTTLVLRTLSRALYSPECRGHYALASPTYSHFTSPIRRYPDLQVHRSLKSLLRLGAAAAAQEAEATELEERVESIASWASTTERRAERAERDILQWMKVRFLADRVGERFSGRITGVQPFGFFVQLTDLHVDGLVPIRTLTDDYYLYEAESHRLVGEGSGRAFRLADPVEVRLVGVDERHRGLDLAVAGLAEPSAVGRGPRRRRGSRR